MVCRGSWKDCREQGNLNGKFKVCLQVWLDPEALDNVKQLPHFLLDGFRGLRLSSGSADSSSNSLSLQPMSPGCL